MEINAENIPTSSKKENYADSVCIAHRDYSCLLILLQCYGE